MDSGLMPEATDRTREMAVVIVTFNSASVLPGLLDSLPAGLGGIDHPHVIVVDNASRDASVDIARAHPSVEQVIQMGRNAGYAAAINAAAAIAPDMDFMALNPDIRLHPGVGRALSDTLQDPTIGIVVPRMLGEDGMLSLSIRREPSVMTAWADSLVGSAWASRIALGEIVLDSDLYARGGPIDWATGAIVAIAARARKHVGEWDETFFLYSEEVDYFQRVRACGLSIMYLPTVSVTHIGGSYHGDAWLSSLMTTNRIRYHSKHHGPVSTEFFRLGVAVGAAMRAALGPGHRAALRAAISFPEMAVRLPSGPSPRAFPALQDEQAMSRK